MHHRWSLVPKIEYDRYISKTYTMSALQSIKFNKHESLQHHVQFWMTAPYILIGKVFYTIIMMKSLTSPTHLSVSHTSELFGSSSFLRKVWIEDCRLAESQRDQDHVEERLGCSRNIALCTSLQLWSWSHSIASGKRNLKEILGTESLKKAKFQRYQVLFQKVGFSSGLLP